MPAEKSLYQNDQFLSAKYWIEAVIQLVNADEESVDAFIAEFVEEGAVGGFVDDSFESSSDNFVDHTCEACGKLSQIRVYFPESMEMEEVADVLEIKTRRPSHPVGSFTARLLQCHCIEKEDWATSWKGSFPPEKVSERFWVVPPWQQSSLPQEVMPIILEPGLAFGTGKHITTRHCLLFLEALALDIGSLPHPVLDIGCGSAILSIAAQRLGARSVFGLDIDPDALLTARRNLVHNRLVKEILLINGPLECCRGQFPLITANLDAATLLLYGDSIRALLEQKGFCIFSGILKDKRTKIMSLCEKSGFRILAEKTDLEEGWTSFLMQRSEGL